LPVSSGVSVQLLRGRCPAVSQSCCRASIPWPVSSGQYPVASIQWPVSSSPYPVASIQWHILLGQFPMARTAAYCELCVWLQPAHQPTILVAAGCACPCGQYPVASIQWQAVLASYCEAGIQRPVRTFHRGLQRLSVRDSSLPFCLSVPVTVAVRDFVCAKPVPSGDAVIARPVSGGQ
jgi:hypothetical protein